jgi:hypothetical protein
MNKEDNKDIQFRQCKMENVRLLNEVTRLNKYTKFLIDEIKNIEQETREDCRAEKEMLQERIETLTAKIDELKKQVKALEAENATLRKDSEESKSKLSEAEELLQIKELNKCDLRSIISVIQRRIFERNSDATRFLNDSIDPHDPFVDEMGFEDIAERIMAMASENYTAKNHDEDTTGDKAATKNKSVKIESKQDKAKTVKPKGKQIPIERRRVYTSTILEQEGIDTSNLPVGAKLIRRKSKSKTGGMDTWVVRLFTYEKPKVKCTEYEIGRFNVPGNDPMCSKYPEAIIKGNPITPSFASFYFESKFAYNLSENRILQMLQSMQTKIPQSSLNNWMHQLMTYMRVSLENLLIEAVKRSYFTHNDEVRILVRSREAADAPFEYKVEYIHAALSLEQKLVVMLYKNEGSRGHEVPEEYLFKGSIDKCFCSDRAKLYETIETDLIQYRIVRASCWFHARHYFVDAYITDHRVYDIIRMINFLFRVDREAKERGLTPEQRFKFRLRYSRKIVTQIIKRLKEIRAAGNEYGELVHRAVNYILDDEKSFLKFLQDGRIELSNNAIERAFRHIAIGRRNWLHTGSHFAAENIAFMYSLYECCKLNDLNFGEYIEDVLIRFMKGEKADESFLPNQYTIKYINKKEQEEEGADKATA